MISSPLAPLRKDVLGFVEARFEVFRRGPIRFDESTRSGENRKVVSHRKCGPVAQLGARFHGMEEVIGSIPIRSTK